MTSLRFKELHGATLDIIKKGWPEFSIVTVLSTGIIIFGYLMLIVIGKVTGVIGATGVLPLFVSMNPVFIISVSVMMFIFYYVSAPLFYGIRWFYMQAARGIIMPLSSVFACYSSNDVIGKCMKMRLFTNLNSLLRCLPGGAVICTCFYVLQKGADSADSPSYRSVVFASTVMIILSLLLTVVLNLDILFASYIFTMDTSDDPVRVIERSRQLSNNYRIFLFKYIVCFMLLFCTAFLAYPLIFIIPYMNFFTAVSLQRIVANDNDSKD